MCFSKMGQLSSSVSLSLNSDEIPFEAPTGSVDYGEQPSKLDSSLDDVSQLSF